MKPLRIQSNSPEVFPEYSRVKLLTSIRLRDLRYHLYTRDYIAPGRKNTKKQKKTVSCFYSMGLNYDTIGSNCDLYYLSNQPSDALRIFSSNKYMYILIIKQRINTNGVRVPCRSEKSGSVREYDTDVDYGVTEYSIPN